MRTKATIALTRKNSQKNCFNFYNISSNMEGENE